MRYRQSSRRSTAKRRRLRATVNEYRLGVQTNDNTQGAVNEARARMAAAYVCKRADN